MSTSEILDTINKELEPLVVKIMQQEGELTVARKQLAKSHKTSRKLKDDLLKMKAAELTQVELIKKMRVTVVQQKLLLQLLLNCINELVEVEADYMEPWRDVICEVRDLLEEDEDDEDV